jgi:maltooligosyltrehalose trehalohydrolase
MMDLEYDRGWRLDLGANPIGLSAVQFRVWAPRAKAVSVHVCDPRRNPVPMEPREFGYFEVTIESVRPGDRYHYIVDGEKVRPDPASRSQPDGVHQASAVVDPDVFGWTDQAWRGLPLKDLIIYELHTGTFTATGTFDAIIPYLEYLKE